MLGRLPDRTSQSLQPLRVFAHLHGPDASSQINSSLRSSANCQVRHRVTVARLIAHFWRNREVGRASAMRRPRAVQCLPQACRLSLRSLPVHQSAPTPCTAQVSRPRSFGIASDARPRPSTPRRNESWISSPSEQPGPQDRQPTHQAAQQGTQWSQVDPLPHLSGNDRSGPEIAFRCS